MTRLPSVTRHAGEDIGRGLLAKILRVTKIEPGELRRHL
jgi:predicted RNA binding protein YcfA (HicA-like mRNA interferase family)